MKLRRVISGIILLVILFTALSKLNAQMNLKGKGHIGAFNNGGRIYYYLSENDPNWARYNSLNFSINHQYLSDLYWQWDYQPVNGNIKYGGFYDGIASYSSFMFNMFGLNHTNGQSLILERYKTNLAADGQRSTYHVEDNSAMIAKHPGYGYRFSDYNLPRNNIDDNTQNPQIRVKYCQFGVDTYSADKYIAYGLYENNEQTNCPLE